jgi:hypothetical protein
MSRSPIHALHPPPPEERREPDRRSLSGVFDSLTGAVLQQTQAVDKLLALGSSIMRLGVSVLIFNVVMTVLMAAAVVALWRK